VVTGSSKLFSIDFDRNERLIRWNSEIELKGLGIGELVALNWTKFIIIKLLCWN